MPSVTKFVPDSKYRNRPLSQSTKKTLISKFLIGINLCKRTEGQTLTTMTEDKPPKMLDITKTIVTRYMLFCEAGIFSAHALTLVGYKAYTLYRDNVVYVALKFISSTLQVNNT